MSIFQIDIMYKYDKVSIARTVLFVRDIVYPSAEGIVKSPFYQLVGEVKAHQGDDEMANEKFLPTNKKNSIEKLRFK